MLYKDVAETIATLIDLSCNNHVDLETDQTFGHKNIRISNHTPLNEADSRNIFY